MKYLRHARSSWIALGVAATIAFLAPSASALPAVGAPRPVVRLTDAWDRTLDLTTLGSMPVLLVYEDQESSKQNQPFKSDLAALAKGDRYKDRIAVVAVADVEGYDYWPVRGFVKDAIQDESRKFKTIIYCDWNGSARRAFGLRRGVSNVVLYGKGGSVLFSREGSMTGADRVEIIALLRRQVDG